MKNASKYIYEISKLMPGDIILTRDFNDEMSRKVMEATQSKYSHALLYVGDSSYIEADKRVRARNLARCLFDDPSDTCVLRIKEKYNFPTTINTAISYVRYVVGNPYALFDAIRLENGITDKSTKDTQICTRLVAKAYARSGLKIVENVEMCTPQNLLESEYVEVITNLCRVADDFDIRFAESYDVTEDMVNATEKLFDSLNDLDAGHIRSMNALTKYVLTHPEDDDRISEMLVQSGYLNVINIEEEKNQYNYNKEEFLNFYGEKAFTAAIDSIRINISEKERYGAECRELVKAFFGNGSQSHYLILLIGLYKQLIEQCDRRIQICNEVLEVK